MRLFPSRRLKVPVHQTIHKDCRIEGTIDFKGGLLIEGTVSGDLHPAGANACITIGKQGSLTTTTIQVDVLIVNGTLRADMIKARQVVLGADSSVQVSSLQGNLVEIHTGAKFEGAVSIRGEVPTTAKGTAGVAKERLLKGAEATANSTATIQGG